MTRTDIILLAIMAVCTYGIIGAMISHIFLFRWSNDPRDELNWLLTLIGWPVAIIVIPIVLISGACMAYWRRHDWDFDFALSRVFKVKLHQDEYGVLYRMPSPWGEVRAVKVKDSTGTYWIPVPRDTFRAKQAVAWSYSMEEQDFHPVRA